MKFDIVVVTSPALKNKAIHTDGKVRGISV